MLLRCIVLYVYSLNTCLIKLGYATKMMNALRTITIAIVKQLYFLPYIQNSWKYVQKWIFAITIISCLEVKIKTSNKLMEGIRRFMLCTKNFLWTQNLIVRVNLTIIDVTVGHFSLTIIYEFLILFNIM
jgi:hypothetical protein